MRIILPEYGDNRVRKSFLLFPKNIDNEIRWLEKASWYETYEENYGTPFYFLNFIFGWESKNWVDNEKEN